MRGGDADCAWRDGDGDGDGDDGCSPVRQMARKPPVSLERAARLPARGGSLIYGAAVGTV